MNKRQEIIDSMVSMLDQAGEDTSSFFKNIDSGSLDEGALETIAALLTKTLAPKLGQSSSTVADTAYAIRNKHGSWYGSPGYVQSSWNWFPTLGQARLYPKISTARKACKYFNNQKNRINKKWKQKYQHLEGIELVSVRLNIESVVDPSQDNLLKDEFNKLRKDLKTHAKEHALIGQFPNGTPIGLRHKPGALPQPKPATSSRKRKAKAKKVAHPTLKKATKKVRPWRVA